MNNKYLAIVLSIAAVIVVVYQVFLRKDTKEIHQQLNQPPQQEGPMFSAAGRPDQPANRGTAKPHVSKSTKKSTGSEKK